MTRRTDIGESLTSDSSKAEAQSLLKRRANQHKKKPTQAENRMKNILRDMQIRFQFQSIHLAGGHYRIFDFYLPKRRTFIEVDGEYHDEKLDAMKDKYILKEKRRFQILRFTNRQVRCNPIGVADTIWANLNPSQHERRPALSRTRRVVSHRGAAQRLPRLPMNATREDAIVAVDIDISPGFSTGGFKHNYWGYDLTLEPGSVLRVWVIFPHLVRNEVEWDAFLLDDGSIVSDEVADDFLEDILEAIAGDLYDAALQ